MQSVGEQAAAGKWGAGRTGLLGRAQESFTPAGMEKQAVEMELQGRKVKFYRNKWPSYSSCW